ncbi:phospho-sugar mutase [Paenibacillus sp. IB182496]|uniref:Phosphoglucomutase n=1 Tax=Paenibacillus sabuli TaxID=2772509 RepID=A0A927BUR8_9BACL|nr:phospho-sugar mutase [Paenibacillus sabuli]MBD2845859.1 phospho-sugar mutase [Paenibacillus sabuli]
MGANQEAAVLYEAWLNDPAIDDATKAELRAIEGDAKEIEDRFYRELQFGTGGLRGVMGAGTNRMNAYTVGKATQGLAAWLTSRETQASVVIAHDSRHQSPEFALEAALVLAANGIVVHLFKGLRPTPQLSYAVRALGANGGIVITASHNPPEYNGYKVYDGEGCQLVPDDAEQVIAYIGQVGGFDRVRRMAQAEAEAAGLLRWLDESADTQYIDTVVAHAANRELLAQGMGNEVRIIYTPLHGAGNRPVRAVLERAGFGQVSVVAAQEQPDGNFSTVDSPNPEERAAFTLALELARENGADLIIGTDPDCDRMGAVVRDQSGEYVALSGNQSGALMIHYLLGQLQDRGELPANGVVVKTIVTSEMGADIARSYGAEVVNTLTGFKYIGERMTGYAETGDKHFLFGYEESYGYLAGTYARDKDAVIASLLISEAAAYYKRQGKTLCDVLGELYDRFGTYQEQLESRTLKGVDGLQKIVAIMEDWRSNPPVEVEGAKVERMLDYARGLDGLPPENVLKFMLEDGSWFCLRPSGTEPKIKVYFAVCAASATDASATMNKLVSHVMARVDNQA